MPTQNRLTQSAISRYLSTTNRLKRQENGEKA